MLASASEQAIVAPQVRSRHCHACSLVPGATKNGTSAQRGTDCLSGSQATADLPASTRSPSRGSAKPARNATIFTHNGAPSAQVGCCHENSSEWWVLAMRQAKLLIEG